ncbi:hypothetical protein LPJ73_006095, partial [Coemansia sp. RSA 2703]
SAGQCLRATLQFSTFLDLTKDVGNRDKRFQPNLGTGGSRDMGRDFGLDSGSSGELVVRTNHFDALFLNKLKTVECETNENFHGTAKIRVGNLTVS